MLDAARVCVFEAGLLAIGVRQPAEEMVEAAILHHQHHNVLNLGSCGFQ
jgi:hypothetical protein